MQLRPPLFAHADPAIILAKAPAPGATRRVTQLQLNRWAVSLGLTPTPEEMPTAIILRRTLRELTATEIQSAVTRWIVESHKIDADLIAVDLLTAVTAMVPVGDAVIECLCAQLTLNSPTALRIRWKEPGGRSGVELIQGLVTVQGEWLEAATDLSANTSLHPGDLISRSGNLDRLDLYLTSLLLDGSHGLTRFIKQGQPVSSNLIRTMPLVARGDLLELQFSSSRVRLRTAGRAEEAGSVGDLISFRNIATGQRLTARIADAQTAQVEALHAIR